MGRQAFGTACVCLLILAGAASAAPVIRSRPAPDSSPPRVSVEFYMEALCPYCANFTIYQILPLLKSGVLELADLVVVPFGNARYKADSDNFECQHGPRECELNAVLSCALHLNAPRSLWLPFFICLEEHALKDKDTEHVVRHCAATAEVDAEPILRCSSGEQGHQLQVAASHRTSSLRPEHQYVPWVVVNGIPLLDDDESIAKFICTAYTGARPDACYDLGLEAKGTERLSSIEAAVSRRSSKIWHQAK